MRPLIRHCIAAVLLVSLGIGHAAPQRFEEASHDSEAALPPPFETTTTVLSSTPQKTVLEVVITPTEPERIATPREVSLGLVALAHTGRIHVTVDNVLAAPTSNLEIDEPVKRSDVPSSFVRIDPPGIWRDIRVAAVYMTPYWSTLDDDFFARRAVITVENTGGIGINEKTRPVRPVSPVWERMYRLHVLNYDSLNLPQLERGTGNRYIVISRSRFNDYVPQFEEWKTQQGYGVKVITLEELGYTNPTTNACMDATKNYVLDAYDTWPDTPEFVLLVGDMYSGNYDGSVWTKNFYNVFYGQGNRPHDQWYGFLEGTDYFADVMVGRLPDWKIERMPYLISKSIWYEKEPHIEGTWQRRAIMTLDGNYSDTINTKNLVSDLLSAWGMNVSEFFNGGFSGILGAVNQGVSFYNYRGDYCDSDHWGSTFDLGDVAYVNNTRKIGVWTILSCSSACFDYSSESTAEAILRRGYTDPANPKGAVAFIGSQAYTAYQYNNPLDKGFYYAWVDSGISILGQAFLSGKVWAWNHMPGGFDPNRRDCMMREYTILGDPSLQVWTAVPTDLEVAASPSSVPAGQSTSIEITVERPPFGPLQGALVCLMKDDVYVYGYTNSSGVVTLPVTTATAGDIQLTVTAYNSVPHFSTLTVLSGPLPPKSPQNVTLQPQMFNNVLLSWSPVTEDVGGSTVLIHHYDVYRKTSAHFSIDTMTPIDSPTTNQFVDSGVLGDPGLNYYYRVVAISTDDVESEPSDPVGEYDYELVH